MKYRDEIHIAMMALVFSCAMFAIYAVVPKDAVVAAKARATVTEAPETAAEAEAIRSSQEDDAGFPISTQDSNYDYDDSSDIDYSSDVADDTSDDVTPDPIVYITDTGSKYHRADCRTLKDSKIEKHLSEVIGSYQPCGVCHPPTQ